MVQGAVIHGVEKARHKALRCMFACDSIYGIVFSECLSAQDFDPRNWIGGMSADTTGRQEQFAWLIRRGDLVLSDEDKKVDRWFAWTFPGTDVRGFDLPIYAHAEGDEDPPELWQTGKRGESTTSFNHIVCANVYVEVTRIGVVACDFSQFPVDDFELHPDQHIRSDCHIAYLRCKMQLSLKCLRVEVLANKVSIGHTSINVAAARSRKNSTSSDNDMFE